MRLYLNALPIRRNGLFVDCVAIINKILVTPQAIRWFFLPVQKAFIGDALLEALCREISSIGPVPINVAKIDASGQCFREIGAELIVMSQNAAYNIMELDDFPAAPRGMHFLALFITILHECCHLLTRKFNVIAGKPLVGCIPPDSGAFTVSGRRTADGGYGFELLHFGGMIGHPGDNFGDICLCRIIDAGQEASGRNLLKRVIPMAKAEEYRSALYRWAIDEPILPW